jgi:hypothetical protein
LSFSEKFPQACSANTSASQIHLISMGATDVLSRKSGVITGDDVMKVLFASRTPSPSSLMLTALLTAFQLLPGEELYVL